MSRKSLFLIWLTEADKQRLHILAQQAGRSCTHIVRVLIKEAAAKCLPPIVAKRREDDNSTG